MTETDDDGEPDEVVWRGPSKSQKKREADLVFALAVQLTQLSKKELAALAVDDELHESVVLCQALKKGARRRQQRRIAKMLRDTQWQSLATTLERNTSGYRSSVTQDQVADRWRARLLTEGDPALDELLGQHQEETPAEQRRELRRLVRAAKREPADARSRRARLNLLRKIRALNSGGSG
jgi:ribosome-associated protein